MEFGKHIGKGIWGFADKSLTVVYGLGFIVLVIRVLPEVEYGTFVLVQALFTMVAAIGTAFALQPLVKYAAESDDYAGVLTVCSYYFCGFLVFVILLLLLVRVPLSGILDHLHAGKISMLMMYLPPLLLGSAGRMFLTALLQTRYRVQQIFWIDSVYFIGSLILFLCARSWGTLATAEDLMIISITAQTLSSILAVVLTWRLVQFKRNVPWIEFRRVWDFGKFSCASSLSFALYAQLDILIMAPFLGVVQTAILGVVKTFTRIFDIFNQVVQLFIVPASSKIHASGTTSSMQVLLEKSIWFSTLALLPVLAFFLFGSDFIVRFLYNGKYTEAIIPMRIAGFLALLVPWYSVLPSLLVGMGKVKEGLYLSWLFIVVSLTLYLLLIPAFGVVGAVTGSVVSSLIFSLSLVLVVRKFVPINLGRIPGRTQDIVIFLRNKLTPK